MKPVLVIEDNLDHQFLLFSALRNRGLKDIEMVASLAEGLAACDERSRGVLIVDSGVVGENKDEAVKQFREKCPDAHIIGYSAGPHKTQWADAHFMKGDHTEVLIEDVARHAT